MYLAAPTDLWASGSENNNITASSGATVDVQGDISTIVPANYDVSIEESTSNITLEDGTATFDLTEDMNSIVVLNKNGKDITKNCKITISKNCSPSSNCTTNSDSLTITKVGTYSLEYKVTYKDINIGTISKTIIAQ